MKMKSEIQDAKAKTEKLQLSGGQSSFRRRGKWTPLWRVFGGPGFWVSHYDVAANDNKYQRALSFVT